LALHLEHLASKHDGREFLTFLFTGIEGSTADSEFQLDALRADLERHNTLTKAMTQYAEVLLANTDTTASVRLAGNSFSDDAGAFSACRPGQAAFSLGVAPQVRNSLRRRIHFSNRAD
jgi:hypothetical protein